MTNFLNRITLLLIWTFFMSFNQNKYAENKISPENFGIYLLSHIILDIPHHSLYTFIDRI